MLEITENKWNFNTLLVGMTNETTTLENSLAVTLKEIPYDSAILLLSIYSREMKAYVCIKTYISMFTATS